MINQYLVFFLLIFAFIAANIPWFSNKGFLFIPIKYKSAWLRWLECLVLYVVSLVLGLIIENRLMGTISAQDWEFYIITFCLFIVFSLPGFIYCYDLKKSLNKGDLKR